MDTRTKEIVECQSQPMDMRDEHEDMCIVSVALHHKNTLKDSTPSMDDIVELIPVYEKCKLHDFIKLVRVFVEYKIEHNQVFHTNSSFG